MMNKEELMEKAKEVATAAKEKVKEEAAFSLKGAVIGISVVYAVKAATTAYNKTKEFISEQL